MYLFVTCMLHAIMAVVLYVSEIYYNNWQFWLIILIVEVIRSVDMIHDERK